MVQGPRSPLYFFITLAHFMVGVVSQDQNYRISTGSNFKTVDSLRIYDSYVPVLLEYIVPTYHSIDVTLRDWRGKCKTDKFAPSYTCPVFYYFEQFMERMEADVVPKPWEVVDVDVTTGKNQQKGFCSKIQRHFKGELLSQDNFDQYIENIERCPNTNGANIKKNISDFSYEMKKLFKKMNEKYEEEFSNNFFSESNRKTGPAFYVNAVTAHQNGLLIALLLEKLRWSSAKESCRNLRIPEMVVKPVSLLKVLHNLDTQGYDVSEYITDTSILYKLPIAECSFVRRSDETYSMVVKLQIPILKNPFATIYSLQGGSKFPFLIGDHACFISQINGPSSRYIIQDNNKIFREWYCNDDTLCYKEESSSNYPITDPCTIAILNSRGNSTNVAKYCAMECIPRTSISLPMVMQVDSFTWVVVPNPDNSSLQSQNQNQVLCKDDKAYQAQWNLTTEVVLGCGCVLRLDDIEYNSQTSCNDVDNRGTVVKITSLIPPHVIVEEANNEFHNLSQNVPPKLIDFSKMNHLLSSQKQFLPYVGSNDSSEIQKIHVGESSSVASLWAIILFQLVILILVCSYLAYKHLKDDKYLTSYGKNDRMVYNIYNSTSEQSLPDAPVHENFNRL